jgi:hypothetical protein
VCFQFEVHSTILRLGSPELNWDRWLQQRDNGSQDPNLVVPPPPLSGLPEDVLAVVLHYIYSLSLPPGLSEESAQRCVTHAANLPGFEPLVSACKVYLNNMALKHRECKSKPLRINSDFFFAEIVSLVSDMHTCAENIVNYFSSKASPGDHSAAEALGNNPAKLCFIVNQGIRECAVGE